MASSAEADVAVVGAGILGLAVARELLTREPGRRLVVLEKEDAIARHQTGHNSGVVHSGIYYAPGLLKAKLCVEGSRLLYDYCAERGIRHERCGKVIVAVREEELGRLAELRRRGTLNGVRGLEEIGRERLAEIEPRVAGIRPLYSPETGIVDFRVVARAFASDVESMGGAVGTRSEVTAISPGERRSTRHAGACGPATSWRAAGSIRSGSPG